MVLDVLVKATLVLGLAALFSVATRGRAPAAVRHAAWVSALVGAALVPVLWGVLPALRVPLLPAELQATALWSGNTNAPRVTIPADITRDLVDATGSDRVTSRPVTSRPPAASALPEASPIAGAVDDTRALWRAARDVVGAIPAIALVWAVGTLVLIARLIAARVSVARVTRTRVPGRAPWLPVARRLAHIMRVSRRLRFLRSDRVAMPMACGVLRPTVVLPTDADGWSSDRLRAVLLHELGHVRRRDCLTQVAADIALALLWFHPLAWVARRAVRRERERACDDLVLAAGTPAPEYASHLLDVARDAQHRRTSLTLAGGVAMARPSELEGRLMAILDDTRPRRVLTLRAFAAVGFITLGVVAPLSALDFWQAPGAVIAALPASPAIARVPDAQEPMPAPTATPMPSAPRAAAPAPTASPEPVAVVARVAPTAPSLALQPTPTAQPAPAPGAKPVLAPTDKPMPVGVPGGVKGGVVAPARLKTGKSSTPPDPKVVAALIEALKDTDEEVRQQALHTLARFRDPSTVDALIGVLSHTDPEMRREAASALGRIDDPRATKALTGLMSDKDKEVRQHALFALARQRDPALLEPLSAALKDTDPEVRQQAAMALGQLRDVRAVPALASVVGDADAEVRQQAVFALGQLRSPEAVPPLLAALKDKDAEVRQQAAFGLGQIRDPRAADALMVAVKDTDPEVRQQAFFALAQVGDPRVQDLAIAGLKDSDPEVRRMAAHALARLADKEQ